MPVTVEEVANGTVGTLGTTPTATLAGTPQAGDVIFVCTALNAIRTVTGISGCGASWSAVATLSAETPGHVWWKGTGGNASGVITVTISSSTTGHVRAFLVHGLASSDAAWAYVRAVSTGAAGPAAGASLGQLVIAMASSLSTQTLTYPSANLPAAGWTTDTEVSSTGNFNSAHRVPSGNPEHHSTTVAFSGSTTWKVSQLVIGTPTKVTPVTYGPQASANTTALAKTIPPDTLVGDLLLDLFSSRHSGTVTSPGGFTLIDDGYYSTAVAHLVANRRAAQAGDAGATATSTNDGGSAKNSCGQILRILGHDPTTPVNTSGSINRASASSQNWPTVTTTADGCLIVYIGSYDNGSITHAPDASIFEVADFAAGGASTQRLVVCWEYQAAAGTTSTRTSTMSSATAMRMLTVAIAPPPSGAAEFTGWGVPVAA